MNIIYLLKRWSLRAICVYYEYDRPNWMLIQNIASTSSMNCYKLTWCSKISIESRPLFIF